MADLDTLSSPVITASSGHFPSRIAEVRAALAEARQNRGMALQLSFRLSGRGAVDARAAADRFKAKADGLAAELRGLTGR